MAHLPTLTLVAALTLQPAFALACTQTAPPRFDGGVGGFEGGVSVSVGRITDRVWEPVRIDGQPVPEGSGLWLSVAFQDGSVTGSTGCNRFAGLADLDAGVMAVSVTTMNEIACADPAATEREALFLKALGEARWFVASPEGLWLTRDDGSVAVCLE